MKADAEEFTKVSFLNLEKVTNPLAELQKKLEEAKILLNEVFFAPLQDAFINLFETGKFGFKSFADAVLKQIQQLVSKIIATGIISLIGNLMFPGVGVASGGASLFAKVGADILKAIGLGGKSVANPSFGGVGPGGLGMSGQVNVVLRGSDLVGALNRTNATINRVG
jgi:lambda family phage tail tape measure protein